MFRNTLIITLAIASTPATAVGDLGWTESFENGVGRLNQTRGNGETVYVWDADREAIDGTFIRYPHSSPSVDLRFAILDCGRVNRDSLIAFSAVVTPLSGDRAGSAANANIGFIDSEAPAWDFLVVRFRAADNQISMGIPGGGRGGSIPFSYGETYFVIALLDGPRGVFEVDVYLGTDNTGTWLGRIEAPLDPEPPLDFNALGFSNPMTAGTTKRFRARIHEISLRPLVRGDLNCDGTVNAFDIEPFLLALFEPSRYVIEFPDCELFLADMNLDSFIDAFDIEPFLNVLFP